jgi:hypothetical protein
MLGLKSRYARAYAYALLADPAKRRCDGPAPVDSMAFTAARLSDRNGRLAVQFLRTSGASQIPTAVSATGTDRKSSLGPVNPDPLGVQRCWQKLAVVVTETGYSSCSRSGTSWLGCPYRSGIEVLPPRLTF